ncbi:hypothetical protein [Nonomuraea pusilla]|uniref:DUF4439 domain-containing protein n=1 Tax=Nonomuraea pusilla TaxID=46177 RepID=A0A1H7RZ83_9ACTN|nr:hypothetical protein [Nonomuraea pusilla]SEL64667.1 hypothetical protein SAMN05660976_02951 [Nonomuraea pusilla]
MRPRHLSRRAVLAGGAVALTACSGRSPAPEAPPPDSPETVLLKSLVAEKERTVALYAALIGELGGKGAERLAPFMDRHRAHLDELRRHLPAAALASSSASPPPSGSPSQGPSGAPSTSPSPGAERGPSLSRLRELERRAAAQRPRQLATASPGLAQLIASIGACEAVHAAALPRSL